MSRLIAGAQCWARDSYGGVFQGAPVPTSPDLSTISIRMKKAQRLPLLRNVFYLHSVYLHKLVSERNRISRQKIEDGLKKTTGSMKEKAGKVLGGRRLEVEARRRGTAEKAEGHVRSGGGKAMDVVRNVKGYGRGSEGGREREGVSTR